MKRSALVVAAFAGLVAGCGVDTFAPPTGGQGRFILRGVVTNLTGGKMQSVTVQVQPLGGGPAIRTMLTGKEGAYRTSGLAAGFYRVIIVMGDSSRITATGRKDTVYVGPSADSTIVTTLTYNPGRVISGSLTYSIQDTVGRVSVGLRGVKVWLSTSAAPTVYIDSVLRTSASGGFRFAVRPGTYRVTVDTTGAGGPGSFRAFVPAVVPAESITAFRSVTASAVLKADSTASGSITYRAPNQVRARIFKDGNNDGVYRNVATDPDTVLVGVRVALRRRGSTLNLTTDTTTSINSDASNIRFRGLLPAVDSSWALHVIRWYIRTGCALVDTTEVPVIGALGSAQVIKDIPVRCS